MAATSEGTSSVLPAGIPFDLSTSATRSAYVFSLNDPPFPLGRISFSNAMPQVSGGHLRGFPDCGDVTVWCFMFTRARAAQVCRSFSEAERKKQYANGRQWRQWRRLGFTGACQPDPTGLIQE